MGYVFGKAFWWILAALLVGGVIGYYWNGWRRSKWVNSATTSSRSTAAADPDETARLRGRVANLEAILPERDQLRARVTELEGQLRECRAANAAGGAPGAVAAAALQGFASVDAPVEAPVDRFAGVEYDFDQARAVLGTKVVMDDLKVIEGIGPKIAELCVAGGISTWAVLADTPVGRIEEIILPLNASRIHKPDTWPAQAELLALGKWEAFKELTDRLTGGKE